MNDDNLQKTMTPFDQYISSQPLQMTKVLIPFLPPQSQRMMAVYVKFLEFRLTLSSFRSMKQSCDQQNFFDALKPYLSSADVESFEQMSNMMNMMSMMQEMQNMSDFDPMSMMSEMFAQENNTEFQKEGENFDGLDE